MREHGHNKDHRENANFIYALVALEPSYTYPRLFTLVFLLQVSDASMGTSLASVYEL